LGTTRPLRVGTDCSGIEAPIQALKNLGINFEHVFSCEIDKYARRSIKANYEPGILYEDITTRDHSALPDIDLYVCGFPCQPFSHAGKRLGIEDPRGTIFWHCLEVIKEKLPFIFILENVKGILSINKGRTFQNIIKSLNDVGCYNVDWKVLNTKDYGIPQIRKRVYIIGLREDYGDNFKWPDHISCNDLKDYIDNQDTKRVDVQARILQLGLLNNIPKDSKFVDFCWPKYTFPYAAIFAPCITRSCPSHYWCVPLSRYANIKELLSIQGFPKDFNQVVSNTQMKHQIGNSMSVNVVEQIINSILS
jgi:DNA (cytosine-5)-methyltransferase 1